MEGVDVLGTGVFCVLGCMSASREKNEAIICVLCGVLTATFGGLTRDVLCRQEVGLLHSKAEILGRSAVAGGSAYLAIAACGGDVALRVWGGVAVSVCVRAWEWTRFIDLPPWFSTKEVL